MDSDRDNTRQLMRETVAQIEAAPAAGHPQVIALRTEIAKGFHAVQRFHPQQDPIVTATLALILVDDREALSLYLEALRQNQVFPDERSYEWRLPLAARFMGTLHVETIRHELAECRAQAAQFDDSAAVSRAESLLSKLPN